MRLGFYYHVPAEQSHNGIRMPGYLGRFIDSIGDLCKEVVCFMHSPHQNQREFLDYQIQSDRVHLIDIGRHCSVYRRTLQEGKFTEPLNYWTGKLDVMLIRGPSPLLPAFFRAASRINISTSLLLVGSYVDGVDDLPQPLWRKEMIRLWSYWNQWQQQKAARKSLTFVNSRKLFEELQETVPNLIETRTTTLSEQDFFLRDDTCQRRPVHLLYTGRYDRGKGLLKIVRALSLLVRKGHDVVIDMVGWDDSGTGVEAELKQLSEELGVSGRFFNHGRKAVGPELFEHYRQADIYVIASKISEGFPRTIWEAMAHSLPVIATMVGSIPQFIENAALLIKPGSVESIVAGVENVISSPNRRHEMICAGLKLARENTLERRSRELINHIESWLNNRRHDFLHSRN